MTYTFTNFDSDGDLSNPDNWNVGGSPAGQVPTSSDTAVLDGQTIVLGTCDAAVTSATSAILNGGTLNGAVTVYGGTFNGILCAQNANIAASFINADPGGGITSSGNCVFTGSFSSTITDTGGYFQSGATFSGPVTSSGGTFNSGATFNSTLTATGGTIAGGDYNAAGSQLTGCSITGGSFNVPMTVTVGAISGTAAFVPSFTFTGVTFDSSFTGTVDHSAACVNCTLQNGHFSDVTCTGDVNITGGSFSKITVSTATSLIIGPGTTLAGTAGLVDLNVPIADYPAASSVYAGTIYANGARTGTLALAASRIGCSMIQRRA